MNSDDSDSMDASLLQLERELKSLTPAPPGRELLLSLHARMEPAVSVPQANKVHVFPWRRMVTPAAAAAAAVAVLSVNNARRAPGAGGGTMHEQTASAIRWEPMPMRREYRELLNAGYVLNENFEPVPQFFMDSLEHHEWRNTADNSSVRLIIPKRYVVPASYDGADTLSARKKMQFQ